VKVISLVISKIHNSYQRGGLILYFVENLLLIPFQIGFTKSKLDDT